MATFATLSEAQAIQGDRPFVIEGNDFSGNTCFFPSFCSLKDLQNAMLSGVGILDVHDVCDQWPHES